MEDEHFARVLPRFKDWVMVYEKNTLANVVRPIASEFCVPLTSGRGQCSTTPLHNIAER